MTAQHTQSPSLLRPFRLFVTTLVIVFLAEILVTFLLPILLPEPSPLVDAVADSLMLVILSAPCLWWVIVLPLRRIAMTERERATAIIAHAADAIVTINQQGRFEAWNPAAERIFGYTAEEIVGKPVNLLMPDRYRDAHEEGLARIRAGGEPRLLGRTVELSGRTKEAREFPVEVSLFTWKIGAEPFYTSIVRDITERKRAERALAERTQQLEALRAVSLEMMRELDLTTLLGVIFQRVGDLTGPGRAPCGSGMRPPKSWSPRYGTVAMHGGGRCASGSARGLRASWRSGERA